MPAPGPVADPADAGARPASLAVAAVLVAVQGLVAVGYALALLVQAARGDFEKVSFVLLEAGAFVLWGSVLLLSARGLVRCRRWARSPVVLSQLLLGLTFWTLRDGSPALSAVMIVVAVVVLVAVLVPSSTQALAGP